MHQPMTYMCSSAGRWTRQSSGLQRLICSFAILILGSSAFAQDEKKSDKPVQADYYRIQKFKLPEKQVLEVGAAEPLPGGKVAFATRRGEIWIVDNAYSDDVSQAKITRFAHGLHEILGLAWRDGWLYLTQRCEVSRIRDTNGDGKADEFETVNDDWSINGDYHEYAFGSKFDKDGSIWVTLCLTGSFNSDVPYRGWCLRVDKNGKLIPTCSGLRSPGGIGFNPEGDVFYTDNQGPWNGTCGLKWLRPGSFQGHPGGNKWFELDAAKTAMGKRPVEPKSGSRIMVEAKKIPEYEPPVILFPYKKMGQSASGIDSDLKGNFGPFKGQMFVGDQTFSTVMRCVLEKVDGHYQGACIPFLEGFSSGTLAVQFGEDGSMFVGGTNRGWGSRGRDKFAFERVTWTGKVPFEIHEMHAKSDGFELTFTKPVDPKTAADIASYKLSTYTYIFQSSYGSPEVDHTTPTITKAEVAANGQSVRLYVDGLQEGHVHELHLDGLKSKRQQPLLHPVAYYTLNYIPGS